MTTPRLRSVTNGLGPGPADRQFRDEARALAGLGRCATVTGSTAEARVLLRQAHQILQRIGAAETQDVFAELDNLASRVSTPSGVQ